MKGLEIDQWAKNLRRELLIELFNPQTVEQEARLRRAWQEVEDTFKSCPRDLSPAESIVWVKNKLEGLQRGHYHLERT